MMYKLKDDKKANIKEYNYPEGHINTLVHGVFEVMKENTNNVVTIRIGDRTYLVYKSDIEPVSLPEDLFTL